MTGIYKIVNKINGKIYVGQAKNIKERWKGHEYKAFNEKEKAILLQFMPLLENTELKIFLLRLSKNAYLKN